MTRVYFKEAVGAFVVFDISRNSSFEAVKKWKQDIDSKVVFSLSLFRSLLSLFCSVCGAFVSN